MGRALPSEIITFEVHTLPFTMRSVGYIAHTQ